MMSQKYTTTSLLVVILYIGRCLAAPLGESHSGETSLVPLISLSLASFVCLVLTVVGCLCCCNKSSLLKYEESVEYEEGPNTNQSHNDAFGDFAPPTQSTPSVPPGGVRETVSIERLPDLSSRLQSTGHGVPQVLANIYQHYAQQVRSSGVDANSQDDIKHLNSPRYVFPRDQLNYVDELGNGWFGKVLQGEAHRLHPGMRKTRVVVKQLRDTATPEEQLLFLQEVQPYREVNHPNVLMLLGQCIESIPLLLVLEYAPYGDLKNYLRKNRSSLNEMAQKDVQLRMAHDIISGLLWLHQADFIHIDLASRNCQVCADTSVKIGDYGLALEKYPEDYYITRDGRHAVPIRWLSPEVIEMTGNDIKPKKITKESNVWSFGVIMLELSTGADRPYPDLTDEEVLKKVVMDQEIKLDKPNLNVKYANRWFEIMMFCWLDADARPTVKEVHELLSHLKKNVDRVDMDDFEQRWNALKPNTIQSSSESSEASPEPQQGEDTHFELPAKDGVARHPLEDVETKEDAVQIQTEQVIHTEVTLPPAAPSLGESVGDLVTEDQSNVPRSTTPVPEAVPAPSETQVTEQPPAFEDDFVTAVTAAQTNAEPESVKVEVNTGGFGFEDDFNPGPTQTVNEQSDLDLGSFGVGEQEESAEDKPTTPGVTDKLLSEDNPFVSSTPLTMSTPLPQELQDSGSVDSSAYNTALGSILQGGDSVTDTESFNATPSNPFSDQTASEPTSFASALESTLDGSTLDSPLNGKNGFGDFESSLPDFATPTQEDLSASRETPTPVLSASEQATPATSDLFAEFSQSPNPFTPPLSDATTASISFKADLESPATGGASNGVSSNGVSSPDILINTDPEQDPSQQSFEAITLKVHDDKTEPKPTGVTVEDKPQGYAEVGTKTKKAPMMTMLTVSSGKRHKSIEIHKDDEDEDASVASPGIQSVVVTQSSNEMVSKDQKELVIGQITAMGNGEPGDHEADPFDTKHVVDTSGFDVQISAGDDQGVIETSAMNSFGAIEVQISEDGQEANVVEM